MNWLLIILGLNALVGAVLFEYVWFYLKIHRTQDEVRDSKFPAWRRNDSKNWSRWKLYPVALTLMPIKVLGWIMSMIFMASFSKIVLWGVDINKPIPMSRRWISKLTFYVFCTTQCLIMGIIPRKKIV
jgi:hypothetical protein